jgi:hypothetical protein
VVIGLEFNSQILRKLKHLHLRLNFTPASQNCRTRTAAGKLSGSASWELALQLEVFGLHS